MPLFSVIKYTLVLGWILAMGWLIRFEAFPHWFEDFSRGYPALTRDLPALRDNWMKVFAGDKHVGYLNSTTQLVEEDSREEVSLASQLLLRLRWGGEVRIMKLRSEVRLNEQSHLLNSRLEGSIGGVLDGSMTLRPEEGGSRFRLSVLVEFKDLPDIRFSRPIEVPSNVIVASPMLDNGIRSLRPGETMRIRTLDPFSADGGIRTLVLRGEKDPDWEETTMEGETLAVRKITLTMGELTMNAWLDEYGRTLRQETPFGLTLVLSTPSDSVQIPDDAALDFQDLMSNSPLPSFSTFPETP